MTGVEFISKITSNVQKEHPELKITKAQAKAIINEQYKVIKETIVNGESIDIIGFGSFSSQLVSGKEIHDFKTNKRSKMDDFILPKFNFSKVFNKAVRELTNDRN